MNERSVDIGPQAQPALTGQTAPLAREWIDAEFDDAVLTRRRRAELSGDGASSAEPDAWGLALSGGGIRSATFCLGLIRGLAKNGLLKRFDYLSTVSGGGYVGASFGRLFGKGMSAEEVERGVESERSIWLWWLRANGRYLTPSGFRDLGNAGVSIARGVVATQIELGILLILLSSVLVLPHVLIALLPSVAEWAAASSPPFSAWLVLLPVPFFFGTWRLFGYWLTRPHPVPGGIPMMGVYAVALAMLATCLFGMDELLRLLPPRLSASMDDMSAWVRIGLATLMLAGSVAMIFGIADAVSIRKAYRAHVAASDDGDSVNSEAEIGAFRQARIDAEYALRRLRMEYTKQLLWATVAFLLVILVAALDWLSWELAKVAGESGGSTLVYGSAGLAAFCLVICRALQPVLQDWKAKHPGQQINLERLLGILIMVFVALIVIAWATFVHAMVLPEILWKYADEGGDPVLRYQPLMTWAILFGASFAFVWLTRNSYDIINMASLHSYYRARIERAYVSSGNVDGVAARFASHPLRSVDVGQSKIRPPDEVVEGDDVRFCDYKPQAEGGPIHLINCCINQTVDDGTRYFNGDRKGVALTLSSLGTVEIDAYPPLERGPSDAAQDLGYLSKWIAISGAAAGSGMGAQTVPAYSALLFLSGARLGFWEPCLSSEHRGRRVDAPQPQSPGLIGRMPLKVSAIVSELFGQFPGLSHGAWYLSDGGHFENTGLYPLIKRELPLIVAADCGADPNYLFEDMESMIRKVRIDFGAEVDFIAPKHIADSSAPDLLMYLGTPESIGPEASNACLLLGRIRYRSGAIGTLLVVKPRRLEDLPFDVIAYADRHPKYPQQSTGDQFFDESQWESYQKLGFIIGNVLTPALLAQAQAVVRTDTIASSSLTGAEKARGQSSSRLQRLRPMVAATAAGTGIGLSLAVAIWQGFGDYREQHRVELEKKAAQGKALAKEFATGKVSPRAIQILGDLKRYDIDGEGSYADTIAALDDCDRRDVMPCAKLKLALAQSEARGDRNYWLTFHSVKSKDVQNAEERLQMLSQTSVLPAPTSTNPDSTLAGPATLATQPTGALGESMSPITGSERLSVAAIAPIAVDDVPSDLLADEPADQNPVDANSDDAAFADISAEPVTPRDPVVAGGTTKPGNIATAATPSAVSRVPASAGAENNAAIPSKPLKGRVGELAAPKDACKGRRIYLHIYDEQSRPAANCVAQTIQRRLGERPIGVENVVATAIRRGSQTPATWRTPAVLYAQAQAEALSVCAAGIRDLPSMPKGTQLKTLGPRVRAARGAVEIWLPPNTEGGCIEEK
jgi:hypothetical protein